MIGRLIEQQDVGSTHERAGKIEPHAPTTGKLFNGFRVFVRRESETINLFTGNYSQFETLRAEQLAQQQAMYARQQKQIKHIQSYVDRFRYKASKARQAQSRLKMLERMEKIAAAHVDSPFRFHFIEPKKQPQHLLGLTDASVGYGDEVILDT